MGYSAHDFYDDVVVGMKDLDELAEKLKSAPDTRGFPKFISYLVYLKAETESISLQEAFMELITDSFNDAFLMTSDGSSVTKTGWLPRGYSLTLTGDE